ncbi:MAG: 50S ribosomal protein L37e [DPANN group archaeon]|nr:50S ribosomal protein L37e [DPANN group archaeon]
MTKGNVSKGRRSGDRNHIRCRRCGRSSYHKQHGKCSSCGYPESTMRGYNWSRKTRLGKRKLMQRQKK